MRRILLSVFGPLLLFSGLAQADDDGEKRDWLGLLGNTDVAAVDNTLYEEECGACHFAYQPGLLPERSWRKLMLGLHDHFGDNAELNVGVYNKLLDYMTQNAADHTKHKRSLKVMRALKETDAPLRITEIAYFQHEHKEVKSWLAKRNSTLRLSSCQSCHKQAVQGSYRENEIDIPGYGRWDD